MFEIILFAPQIPPNTGNIIRLSANTGATLHLVEPLGFRLDEKSCRRAGLDYLSLADVNLHKNLDNCIEALGAKDTGRVSRAIRAVVNELPRLEHMPTARAVRRSVGKELGEML